MSLARVSSTICARRLATTVISSKDIRCVC
jgi:hypothetical protein